MAQRDEPEVSVIIPCLNEAQSLAACIDKAMAAFHQSSVCVEVIVADNGSTDDSVEIATRHGARVVHAPVRGYGNALRAGIDAARGQFIVMGDADDTYDFSEVPRFLAKWREGFELVMGNRFQGEIQSDAMPWHHRYIGNPALTTILNLFFRAGIGDAHCGMRGFTKALYQRLDLRTGGMEFASELIIKAARMGARITEIPITLRPARRGRPSHLRTFHDGWRHLRFMMLYAPNWLFLLPGAALAALGIALVAWLLPGPRQIRAITFDVHTMLFGMIFVQLGMQIILTGLFAKIFSYSERFDPHQNSLDRLLKRFQLEHGLLAGTVLALAGLAGDVRVFWQWAASGFGPLYEIREVIFWSMWFFLGVQVVFSSFLLSMLGISRGTYIGEHVDSSGRM